MASSGAQGLLALPWLTEQVIQKQRNPNPTISGT